MPEITPAFLGFSVNKLRQLTERIETCARMLSPEQVWARGHENENSIGNLVLHLSGNVRQWIVSSLGEKEDHRDRDSEFTARGGMSQDDLLTRLRATIDDAIPLIETCTPEKLLRTYRIQKHEVTGLEVIYHVVEHFALHTGQIIFVTKMLTTKQLGFYSYLTEPQHNQKTP